MNHVPLTPRWYPLRPHTGQKDYWTNPSRFKTVPAGRRSGKTELAKRKVVHRALLRILHPHPQFQGANFFAAAPIYGQAKRIYWKDLKQLIPSHCLLGRPRESDLILPLQNGVEIHVIGMDKPERIEGSPWDGGVLDEYANMKPGAWTENIRPALSDRNGWCDMIGVPEGRNHYYDLCRFARADTGGEWSYHSWPSSDILPAAEIESARRTMDALTFAQEYEASFVNFTGQAYYSFSDLENCSAALAYNPNAPLIFAFDFNVAPGVAVVLQEQVLPGCFEMVANPHLYRGQGALLRALAEGRPDGMIRRPVYGTGVIGEVYIPQNSNTPAVCRKLIVDWGNHKGEIHCYGDATGGARGTAKVEGSDWELIERWLGDYYGSSRIHLNVPRANPAERSRVNAVNTRLKTTDGVVRLLIDPESAPNLIKDLEGVRLLEGGSGEIDKKKDPKLTHISDALGYYVHREFPMEGGELGGIPVIGR